MTKLILKIKKNAIKNFLLRVFGSGQGGPALLTRNFSGSGGLKFQIVGLGLR